MIEPKNKAFFIDLSDDLFILSPMEILFHGRGSYPVGAVIGPNCWPHHDLLVARRGGVSMDLAGAEFVLDGGDALIIPPGTPFSGRGRSEDAAIWVLHYRNYRALNDKVRAPRDRPAFFRQALRSPFACDLLEEITSTVAAESLHCPYVKALAMAVLTRLATWEPLAADEERERKRLLPEGPNEPPSWQVADLARAAGLCESHYRVRFSKAFGESPRKYLGNLRASKARLLLRETRLPIKEIAERVGYADVVAFHRAFAATHGCTPGRFRRDAPPVA